MQFLTLSEKEIKDERIYRTIKTPHIVISITSEKSPEIMVPRNAYCKDVLYLKFDDISDIDSRFLYFTRAQATEVLEFVERHVVNIQLIVVQCEAGLSRSVGLASALSKILNYTDDSIFCKGIPNMFVYTTILDTFFGNAHWPQEYNKINMHRIKSMGQYLSPALIRLSTTKEAKRNQ